MTADDAARISALESEIAQLRRELDELRSAAGRTMARQADPPDRSGARWSRRAVMLGAAAAAAAAADAVATPTHARAAAGDTLKLGQVNTSDSSATWLGSTSPFNTLVVSNSASAGADGAPQALVGMAIQGTGVMGTTSSGVGVRGDATSGTGLVVRSTSGPHIRLTPGNFSSAPASGTWTVGSMVETSTGELWMCVASGTPGDWRLIGSGGSAGAYVPITPTRVYDSRTPSPSGGQPLGPGTDRFISVRDGRNIDTGAITVPNLVPQGTIAITANITVTGTVGSGFISLAPGNTSQITASAINWWASGQTIANGLTLAVNAAGPDVKAFCRVGTTHLVIDVTGYFGAKTNNFG